MIAKNEDGIVFQEDTRDLDFTKSKLTTSYLNASIVPVFNTGNSKRDKDCGYCHSSEFRIGAGAYAGYRLISYAKQQFKIEGETKTDRTRDNYFMQNIRYGLRLQIGIHDLDFFFNYDLNKIFEDGKGPGLNAYSFGLTF